MANKMGFEGKLYYGAAASEATTEVTNSRDISYNLDHDTAETTVRGTGTTPPIKVERVVARSVGIEWTMLMDDTDATLTALLTAAAAGTPVALRTKDKSAGKGFNGDVTVSVKHGMPIKGEQTYQFSAKPTDESGRTPSLYA